MLNYSNIKIGKWDLHDLIDDKSTSTFANLVNGIKKDVGEFEANRQILKPDLDGPSFEGLVHKLENIMDVTSIVNSFAQLKYAADTSSNEAAALVLETEKMSSQISNQVLFFDLWFMKTVDTNNAERLIDSLPSVYREYLKHKRLVAKYSLNESEEKIINTLEVTGTGALVKIYDRMTNNFEFSVVKKHGKTRRIKIFKNKEKLLSLVRSPKAYERETAYKALFKTYEKNSGVLGEIYQNLVTQWKDENISIRGFKSPISVRNIYNNIDDTTVETLLAVCKENAHLFHDYFVEKAKLIGMKKLRRYDLYAPISSKNIPRITFRNATKLVLDKGARNVEILKQPQYSPMPVEKQVAIIYLGTQGLLRDVPVRRVKEFEEHFLMEMENKLPEVLQQFKAGNLQPDLHGFGGASSTGFR